MLGDRFVERDYPQITAEHLVSSFACLSAFVFDVLAIRGRNFGLWADSLMLVSLGVLSFAYLAHSRGRPQLYRALRLAWFVCLVSGTLLAMIAVGYQWSLGTIST
jgi:hypothetical protein